MPNESYQGIGANEEAVEPVEYRAVGYSKDPEVWAMLGMEMPGQDDGQFVKGFKQGLEQTKGLGHGVKAFAGDVIGDEEMRQSGLAGYERKMQEADLYAGNVQNFTDIGSKEGVVKDALDWTAHTLGTLIPSVGTAIAGGGVGGIIAKHGATKVAGSMLAKELAKGVGEKEAAKAVGVELAKQIAKKEAIVQGAKSVGQGLGAYAASTGMELGSIYGETKDADVSAIHAAIAGGLDALPVIRVLGKFGAGDAAKKAVINSIPKEVATQALMEGGTEGLQTLVEQHAKYWVDNNGKSLLANLGEANWMEVANAAAAGALGGGVMGGGVAGLQRLGGNGEQVVSPDIPLEGDQGISEVKVPDVVVPKTPLLLPQSQTAFVNPQGQAEFGANTPWVNPQNDPNRPLGGIGSIRQAPTGSPTKFAEQPSQFAGGTIQPTPLAGDVAPIDSGLEGELMPREQGLQAARFNPQIENSIDGSLAPEQAMIGDTKRLPQTRGLPKPASQVAQLPAPAQEPVAPEPVKSEKQPASWVIREKESGNVVMETFDRKKVDALNTKKYEAVPIQDYLVSLNRKIKSESAPVISTGKSGQTLIDGDADSLFTTLKQAGIPATKRTGGVSVAKKFGEQATQLFATSTVPETALEPELTPVQAIEQPKPQNETKTDRLPLLPGDRFTTESGRVTSPLPKSINHKNSRGEIAMREWLKEEAIAEAEAKGDKFNARQWRALNPKNWSQSDGDSVNLYLFGDEIGRIGSRKVSSQETTEKPKAQKKPVKSGRTKYQESIQVRPDDTLLTVASKRGGLNLADWLKEGIDPADAKKNQYLSKVFGRPTFSKSGTLTPDALAEILNEEGYSADTITANDAIEMVKAELAGKPTYRPEGRNKALEDEAYESQSRYGPEDDDYDPTEFDILTEGMSPDQIAAFHAAVSMDINPDNYDLPDYEQIYNEAMGAYDDYARGMERESEDGAKAEEFSLGSETETEARAREKVAKERADKERKAKEAEEQRIKADSELSSFTLSGSDRQADIGDSVGQGDIFDQPESKAAPDTKPLERDSFTIERYNDKTDEVEKEVFARGEYVRTRVGNEDRFGEIDGISNAKKQATIDGVSHDFMTIYKAERPAKIEKKKEPLSTAVESLNKKQGADLNQADEVPSQPSEKAEKPADKPASKTPIVDKHIEVMNSVRAGNGNAEQMKASFETVVSNKDGILAELNTKTKAQLLDELDGWKRQRYANEKKAEIAEAVYRDMVGEYSLSSSITYGMGKGSYEAAVRKMVEATDDAKIEKYVADRKAAIAEAVEARKAKLEGLADPKTLNDFRSAINERIRDGQTRKEAFLSLTPEQRAKYDELEAESTREARETRKRAQKTEVRTAGQSTGGEIVATKHTKTGEDLYVVKLAERLSREDYTTVLASAKRMGGWYSAFRGDGAVPGFQFKTRDAADAFLKLAGGDDTDAKAQAAQRRDSFEDDRSQSAVERLREMSESIEERAQAELDRERKTNTSRRARFAASAERAADAEKALARTMTNIANAIEDGNAKFLDAVRTKTQVEALTAHIKTAKDNELRAKYTSYSEQEKRRGEPPSDETADFAEFPIFSAFRSDLASLARQMVELDGTKKLGQQLMKVADDISDAYIEFAKKPENLARLSTFSIKRGDDVKTAIFSSRDTAEQAIKRSGLTGKAIVLVEKRGVNRIIMSPSEAMNQRIWTGDGDKRITLTADFGTELVEAIGRRSKKQGGLTVPWQFQTAYDRRKMLSRIGIETASEFRSALREFIALQERATVNKVREMELSMVGRKSDGLDFFPTPEEIADQMVSAAEIQPDMAVLEPSAGMGHIADRIRAAGAEPDVIEFSGDRRELLIEKGYNTQDVTDFLELKPREFFTYGDVFKAPDGTEGIMRGAGGMGSDRVRLVDDSGEMVGAGYYNRSDLTGVKHRGTASGYDRIIMNPPFSNRRDAEHVQHAYSLLKPGGRIVAIMGEGVFFGSDKKAQNFREWLDSVEGTSEKLPDGSFMDSSLPVNTAVNARMVVIDKPESANQSDDSAMFSRSKQTETAAFKKWFGDSKVVEAEGKPMVVYHGTGATNYIPRVTKAGSASAQAELQRMAKAHGIEDWTSVPTIIERWVKTPELAERFGVTQQVAEHARELQRQARAVDESPPRNELSFDIFEMPSNGKELGAHFGNKKQAEAFGEAFQFYLKLENPLRLPDLGTWDYQSVMREARKSGVKITETEYDKVFNANDNNAALRDLLLSKGIDGVVYENEAEGEGDSYIAFNPTQIKSAIGNNGNFDGTNPDIRFARADAKPSMPLAEVENAVSDIIKTSGLKIPVNVVATESALPQAIIKQAEQEGATGEIDAVHYNGQIYIVADKARSVRDIEESILHEASHYGGRALFGKAMQAAYSTLWLKLGGVSGIKSLSAKAGVSLDAYIKTADKLLQAGKITAQQRAQYLVDEYLAHVMGTQAYDTLMDKVKRAIQAFIGSLREMLRKSGMVELSELTDSDLALLMRRISRASQGKIGVDSAPVFMRGEKQETTVSDEPSFKRTSIQADKTASSIISILEKYGVKQKSDVASELKENYNAWDKFFGTLDNLARRNPVIRRFTVLAKDMQMDKDEILAATNDAVQSWNGLGEWRKLSSTEDQKKLASALYDGTLASDDDRKGAWDNKLDGWTDRALTEQFGLDAKGIEAYRAIRSFFNNMTNEYRDRLLERMGVSVQDGDVVPAEDTREADAEELSIVELAMKDKTNASQFAELTKRHEEITARLKKADSKIELGHKVMADFRGLKGYFPLMRFGNHTVSVYKDDELVHFATRESERKAKALANELSGKFGDGYSVKIGRMPEIKQEGTSIDMRMLMMLGEYAEQEPSIAGILDDVEQKMLKEFANSEFRKRFIHRKGMPGFEDDVGRTIASYGWSASTYLSKMRFLPKMQEAITDMDKKAYPQIVSHLNDLLNYIKTPSTEYAGLKQFTFIYYMGANVKSAIVNMSQVAMTLYPHLASQFGDIKTTSAITKSYKLAASKNLLDPKLKRMFEWAEKEGLTMDAYLGELIGAAKGQRLAQTAMRSKALESVTYLFAAAERYNRRIALAATYELTKSKSLLVLNEMLGKRGIEPQANHDLAMKEVIKSVITKTQFDYGKFNRPKAFRGVWSVPLQFHQFMVNYLQFIFGNGGGKGAAIRSMVVLFAAAGLMGLPGAEDLRSLLEYLYTKFTGKHFDAQKEAREFIVESLDDWVGDDAARKAAEAALYGGFSLATIDVSGSLGVGKVLPGATEFFDTAKDKGEAEGFAEGLSQAMGASAGIVKRMAQGAHEFSEGGDWASLYEKVIPSIAFQNLAKAIRVADQGVDRSYSGKVSISHTPSEIELFAQALSFPSAERKRLYRIKNQEYRESQFLIAAHRRLITPLAAARADKNQSREAEARKAIATWNATVPPKWKLSFDKVNRSLKARQKTFEIGKKTGYGSDLKQLQGSFNESREMLP